MPKNSTGGYHKNNANKESGKSVKNRRLVDDLLDDIRSGEINLKKADSEVAIGRIEKRLGNSRFQVWLGPERLMEATICGRMTGKGGKIWINAGHLVVVDRGDVKSAVIPRIIGLFDEKQTQRLKKEARDLDERFFLAPGVSGERADDLFEFDRGVDEPEEKDGSGSSSSDSEINATGHAGGRVAAIKMMDGEVDIDAI